MERHIAEALSTACSIDHDDKGYILADTTKIIRRDNIIRREQEALKQNPNKS